MKILPLGRASRATGCPALVACGDFSALTEPVGENGRIPQPLKGCLEVSSRLACRLGSWARCKIGVKNKARGQPKGVGLSPCLR